MKHASLWIVIGFCSGLILAFKITFTLIQICILAIAVFIFCFRHINNNKIFLPFVFLLFMLLGIFTLEAERLNPDNDIANFIASHSGEIALEGTIASYPAVYAGRVSFLFAVCSFNVDEHWYKCTGKLLAYMLQKHVFFGERLLVKARIIDGANRRKTGLTKIFITKSRFLRDKPDNVRLGLAALQKLRSKIALIINSRLSPVSAALLNAILLGLKDKIPIQLRNMFISTGTGHIIAISGLHLGVIAFVNLMFLKLLRLPYALRAFLSVILLISYCLFAGASASLMRSTIMFAITLLGYTLKRDPDIINCLSLAALIILVFFPLEITQPSFQFTFISMLAIVLFAPVIKSLRVFRCLVMNRYLKFPVLVLISSFSAWVGLLPLSLYYFKTFSLIAIVANSIVVPYVSLIVVSGLVFIISALLFKDLSWVLSLPLELGISILLKIIIFFNSIPGGHFHIANL